MSDEYQNRKDIDALYDLIYDRDKEELNIITKEDFEKLLQKLGLSLESDGSNDITTAVVWNDGDNQDGFRPPNFNATISRQSLPNLIHVLTEDNDWTQTSYLGSDDFEISFPTHLNDVYSQEVQYDYNGNATCYMNHTPELRQVSVYFITDDYALEDVEITLYRDGEEYATTNVSSNDNYKVFGELPKYYNPTGKTGEQQEHLYVANYDDSLKEHYICSLTGSMKIGYTIRAFMKALGKIVIDKTVVLENSYSDYELDDVIVNVKDVNDINPFVQIPFSNFDGDTYVLDGINAGTYEVYLTNIHSLSDATFNEEQSVTSMTVQLDQSSISNVHLYLLFIGNDSEVEPDEDYINVWANAVWNDNNDSERVRPSSIPVTLYAGSQPVKNGTLSEDNNWTYQFENLPEYVESTPINYTVSTDPVSGYAVSVSGTTITLTHEISTINRGINIVFDSGTTPFSELFVTLSDGTVRRLYTDNWSASVNNLPVYVDGVAQTYTWKFTLPTNYQIVSYSESDNVTTYTVKYWVRPDIDDPF